MDDTTEPILVVIGHPIAGNPAQFAAERALRSLNLDWRVLSFDVQPEHVEAALEGFAVTGIKGVLIDQSLANEARQWYANRRGDADSPFIDCLYRDSSYDFVGAHEQHRWIDEQITRHGGQRKFWIGSLPEEAPRFVGKEFQEFNMGTNGMADAAANADVIAIHPTSEDPIDLDSEEWPANDGSTLVIDLSAGHPELPKIRGLGYRVLTENERRIGTIQRCLHRWTGHQASAEVIHDAIEEYLSA